MSTIEDGGGKNGKMRVNKTQRGDVSSAIAPRTFYAARDKGLAYSVSYHFTAAAGEHIAYLTNTSSTQDLFVGDISFGGINSILWKGFFCTGTAAAGESLTPTPLNDSKNIPAAATAMAGDTAITGLTTAGQFTTRRSPAAGTEEESFDGAVILGPGNALVIEYDTGTGGIGEVDIHFHFEDLATT